MSPDTGTAILVLAVFVLPGFVTLLFRERLHVVRREEQTFERLLQALYYSALIYAVALLGGLALGLENDDLSAFYRGAKPLEENVLAGVAVGIALPALIAVIGARWGASRRVRPQILRALGGSSVHGITAAWNVFFGQPGTCMIRVTLSDGRIVGGFYGAGSMAAYAEHGRDLYIAQRWELDDDGWFVRPAAESLGVWIAASAMVSFEAYAVQLADDSVANAE